MVPSSCRISQSTPAGWSPASCARSTAASVWPARRSTPPALARSGKTWPGCTRSSGLGFGIGQDADGRGAIRGADAGGDAARGIDGNGEIRALALAIIRHHALQAELLRALRW